MSTVVVTYPPGDFGCRYEVYFRAGRPEAVARDPRGRGQRGRPVDVWWRLKGPPTKRTQAIIDRAREVLELAEG